MKVLLPNGAPTALADAMETRGGAWMSSDTIVFAPDLILTGLSRVNADGGATEPLTLLDPSRGETSHWWPVALPDGTHFLYLVRSINDERRGIYLGRVDQPTAQSGERLFYSESSVTYLPIAGSDEAELVYMANGRVESRRFNATSLTADAHARTVDFLPARRTVRDPLLVSASADVMAFATSVIPVGSRMVSMELDGKDPRYWGYAEAHLQPRVSPDGKLGARSIIDETRSQPDFWIEDLERGTFYPVLRTLKPDMSAIWSPDGRQLAYVTGHLPYRHGELVLNVVAADGTGVVRPLPCPGDYCEPSDWSRDGSTLLLTVLESENYNVWTVPADGSGAATPLLAADFNEKDARWSPDGRWLAYVSEEAGHPEVLVHSAKGPARRYVISGEGGVQPVWRRDGKLLYFLTLEGQLRSVAVGQGINGEGAFGLATNSTCPRSASDIGARSTTSRRTVAGSISCSPRRKRRRRKSRSPSIGRRCWTESLFDEFLHVRRIDLGHWRPRTRRRFDRTSEARAAAIVARSTFQQFAFVRHVVPLLGIGRRVLLFRDVRPDCRQLGIQLQEFILVRGQFGIGKNCVDRALRYAQRTVGALVGVDHENIRTLVKAVHRTDFHAVRMLALDAVFADYESH